MKSVLAISLLLASLTSAYILPRQNAPVFNKVNAVVDAKFQKVSLGDYAGKYLVLLFYPFDFTYVCPTELISFSENIQKFKELGAEVLGISTDSHFTHLAWIKTPRTEGGLGHIEYPLIADISKEISRSYGVLVEDHNDDLYGAALRGLFVIDGNGKIRSMQINDAPVGRSVDETLRLIQAFQHTDKNGEVCPANWKPGQKTIIPDQEQKKKYFGAEFADTL
ncbi:tsa family protein [Stylonychia lemnae]|uniref:thioredoxin-dependent peroxiredoxin n=1 Tax=Stylonychia lemnae TaxID=5949 RepID=A0A078ACT7_STYLE|nr:tsa family protein [Stylonychia lemnae]|eukprot:CDW79681.1 tsa family protein [Stylonychia lemnae]